MRSCKNNNENNKPINATLYSYDQILKSLELQAPKHVKKSRQYISLLDGYAIMETIFHPNEDNYSISIRNNDYKLWVEYLVNWNLKKIIKKTNQKLFKISNNEEKDVTNLSNNLIKDNFNKMFKVLNSFVQKNFSDDFNE